MFEFLWKLFDTSDFPARWHCGQWSSGHGWLHVISDSLVFGAYLAIPVALVSYVRYKKQDIAFPKIGWLFGAFILACGLTHLIEATIFWVPWYRFSGIMKLVTAIVSWTTVVALIRIAPTAMALPGLAEVNRKLEDRIQAHQETEVELERTNQHLREFSQIVSHDLKSPISSAMLIAYMLQESVARQKEGAPREEWFEDQVDQLVKILNRSSDMVNDLHEFALAGEVQRSVENVPLAPLLEEVIRGLSGPIEQHETEINVQDDLPVVRGNKSALFQVFSNLVENAIKYRGEQSPRIRVEAKRDGDDWLISVIDNGIGIDPSQFDRIFEPFIRLNADEDVAGSGLGLAVCAKLLKMTGGEITVDSAPNEGTTFIVRLPSANTAAEAL